MRSETPKHLHPLLGKRLVDWVFDTARALGPEPLVVVTSPETKDALAGDWLTVAVQTEPRGTADAVAAARGVLGGFQGDLLVLSGDSPLLTPELLQGLVATQRESRAAATVLTFEPARPLPYGRVVRDGEGNVRAIVEERDATEQERAIRELNSSTYVFDAAELWGALDGLKPDNAQGELYLTDTVRALVDAGKSVATYKSDDPEAPVGINTRVELAEAAGVLRDRINERHMLAGATIVDPRATWIDPQVELEPDAVVHPFTVLRGATRVRRGAEVGPHVVAIDAEIGERALVGPFCYLRPGTVLEAGAKAALSSSSRIPGSEKGQRCHTCPTSATPRSARRRTSAPARSPLTIHTCRVDPRGGRKSAATSGPASTMPSLRQSRSATTRGSRSARS